MSPCLFRPSNVSAVVFANVPANVSAEDCSSPATPYSFPPTSESSRPDDLVRATKATLLILGCLVFCFILSLLISSFYSNRRHISFLLRREWRDLTAFGRRMWNRREERPEMFPLGDLPAATGRPGNETAPAEEPRGDNRRLLGPFPTPVPHVPQFYVNGHCFVDMSAPCSPRQYGDGDGARET